MKKNQLAILIVSIIVIIGIIFAVVKLNSNDKTKGDPLESEDTQTEEVEGTVLDTLPEGSFEIQDNTITDTWGVVLRYDQLPEELQDAESYTITIDGVEYDLTINKYNDNVYNGQVSSVEHTEEEVSKGVVNKKE